jgi:hypothetical protein
MLGLVLAGPAACAPAKDAPAPLVLERTIPLNGVAGRIDHLAVDLAHRRIFVAELGAGAVEAIDLDKGASLGRINGLKEPQGLGYLPALDELVVASGGDGSVRFYRAGDLEPIGLVHVGGDADNIRLDGQGRVVVGYGSGALAVIDPVSRKVAATLAMPAHPESFRLLGDRVWVNVPDAGKIVAGNLSTGAITATWPAGHHFNFPMALSADGKTMAVVYRLPSRLQLLDPANGRVQVDRGTCGDADDVFFDTPRRRIYVICGAGAVDVVTLDTPIRAASVPTRPGARTGLFVPEWDRLVVAARANGGDASLLIFKLPDALK